VKLSDLKPDTKNANRGTIRGRKAVSKSLQEFGAGRSVLIDRDGVLIAGNKTFTEAQAAGIENVIVVQSDGSQLVAVQRTDLSIDDPKARGLAIADNRASEVGLEWDPGILDELSTDLELKPFFTDAELDIATGKCEQPTSAEAEAEWARMGMPEAHNIDVQARQITLHFQSEEDVQAFAKVIGQTITDKTKYLWYPEQKPIVARKTKYVEQDSTEISAIHSEPVPMG
jgi:hypothetical protein